VAELLAFLPYLGFSALAYQEGRSFMTGHLGERITGERITIVDDAWHPRTLGVPFDLEGVPRRRVTLIERGVARGLVYDTATAARAGEASTGHSLLQPNVWGPIAQNLVIEPGESTPEEMIAATGRGILVTRFWYNRVVDPLQTIVTGMTRDGTFLIEDGRVAGGVRNLRFNQSVLGMLAQADMIGREGVLTAGVVAPAMRVRGFRFTGVTRF
jgi:predicted Zn-dependent protease